MLAIVDAQWRAICNAPEHVRRVPKSKGKHWYIFLLQSSVTYSMFVSGFFPLFKPREWQGGWRCRVYLMSCSLVLPRYSSSLLLCSSTLQYEHRLFSMTPIPMRFLEVFWMFSVCSLLSLFNIFVPTYDKVGYRLFLETANDTVEALLMTFIRDRSCPFLFVISVATFVVTALIVSFLGPVGFCSVSHLIHADYILDSTLQDAEDFASNVYNFVCFQFTWVILWVIIGD